VAGVRRRQHWVAVMSFVLAAGCGQAVTTRGAGSPTEAEPTAVGQSTTTLGYASVAPGGPIREQATSSRPVGPASGAGHDPCGAAPMMTVFRLPASGGRPSGVAAGEDGSVWFTDPGTASIGRLDVTGSVSRYLLALTSQPGAIARGPDGNFWFTEAGVVPPGPDIPPGSTVPAIGRITPAGVVSHFLLPPEAPNPMGGPGMGSPPAAITAGPDGALWFTEAGADQIGRITPVGAITEFALPSRGTMHAHPTGIVAGSDGAVWFTQPLRESLGRIDVATHAISEFFLPPPRGGIVRANTLASGSGALWFEDPRNQAIGRMRPGGTVDTLPLPATGDYSPWAVTAGPDDNIWFLDGRGSRVMRITPAGSVTEFPPLERLSSGGASQMTASSDGAIWFAVPDGNAIGRITCAKGN
jgi:streptogramin lyase